jgi:predicted RecB family nuclease
MAKKITKDVLESYLNCKYKAHLKLLGQEGAKSDYEMLLTTMRADVKLAATKRIFTRLSEAEVLRNVSLTTSTLKQGAAYILDGILEDDLVSMTFDGLKKVDGPSKLGDFHYIPILFHGERLVRAEQRTTLAILGLLLSRVQGLMPPHGLIWYGKDCEATKVRLNADLRKTERQIRDLKEIANAESPPLLILNDHCHICEFRQNCHTLAIEEDHLSLLRGIGEKEIKEYSRKGIFSVKQLAHTFRPRRRPKSQKSESYPHYYALQAMALRDTKVCVIGTKPLPTSVVQVFLDVESDPDEGYVYLIGIIILGAGEERRFSFWAERKEQEPEIFSKFLDELSRHEAYLVYSYGAFEKTFLNRMLKVTARTEETNTLLKRLVNILSHIYSHIYFPVYSNGLKEIGRYLGVSWTDPRSSGIQSIVWRKAWEEVHSEEWKRKLLNYNMDDCIALKRVAEFVYTIEATNSETTVPDCDQIVRVKDAAELPISRGWGGEPCSSDFMFLQKHAFFDYQSQRVYIRSSDKIRRQRNSNQKKGGNLKLRASMSIQIRSSTCPSCGGTKIRMGPCGKQILARKKRVFDLVLTGGSVKRRVIDCRAEVHQCVRCGEVFIPLEHRRVDKYFHGLKSWAIFLLIKRRLSSRTISHLFKEFFRLQVFGDEIHEFRLLLALFYKVTHRSVIKNLLAGNLLHIDETEVQLRTGKGYVWVFTNLEDVVFIYRPTRSADFLKLLLKDFRGVLVSDFYSAYDGIECPQQKCLIHLMRDMNQALLNNPFDEELKSVTQPFGSLLRQIVTTIDQHGLMRNKLEKHQAAVDGYFQSLTDRSFRSEVSETLRARLLKYRDKLFTFIQHDGVPWNNNNAENAIREFGYYRDDTKGQMRVPGLREYLLLLSICHTCKFKGVSFLKFLLSKEQNIDTFCQRTRRNKPMFSIELYPEGYTPRSFERFRRKKVAAKNPNIKDQDELGH